LGFVCCLVFAVSWTVKDRFNTFKKLTLPEHNLSGMNLVQFGYL
jgi:hypothetical protein